MEGFPGSSVVKNPPANAEDTGSPLIWADPTGPRATKPTRHKHWACALEAGATGAEARRPQGPCSATREAATMRSPGTATREKPEQAKTQHSHR